MTTRIPTVRKNIASVSALIALAGFAAACVAPGASAAPSPSDAMMEHSAAPSDAMMEHSPSPS